MMCLIKTKRLQIYNTKAFLHFKHIRIHSIFKLHALLLKVFSTATPCSPCSWTADEHKRIMLCYFNPSGFGLANFRKPYSLLKPPESGETQTTAVTVLGCYLFMPCHIQFQPQLRIPLETWSSNGKAIEKAVKKQTEIKI